METFYRTSPSRSTGHALVQVSRSSHSASTRYDTIRIAHGLAVEAHQLGLHLSDRELVELAARLAHWSAGDEGFDPDIRNLISDAFANQLPESLRRLDSPNLLEFWTYVDRWRHRVERRLVHETHGQSRPRGKGAEAGGPAVGGLSEKQRSLLLEALRLWAPHLLPLDVLTDVMPRGPPVLVLVLDLTVEQALSVLAEAGWSPAKLVEIEGALHRLVMSGWRDPGFEARPEVADGVVVMTRAMLEELAEHRAAGRISDADLQEWLADLTHWAQLLHDSGAIETLLDLRRAAASQAVAFDVEGRPFDIDAATRAALHWLVDELAQRKTRSGPRGLAIFDGDRRLRDLLEGAGLGSATVVYLLDGEVLVSLRTAGDALTTLRSVQLGAVDPLLAALGSEIEALIKAGVRADPKAVEEAPRDFEHAEQELARIAVFIEHNSPQASPDLDELRDYHTRNSEYLRTLRTRLDSLVEAQRPYEGLDADERKALAKAEAAVARFRDALESATGHPELSGDPEQQYVELGRLLKADPAVVIGRLGVIREGLAAFPQVAGVTDLSAAVGELQRRYEQLYADVLADRLESRWRRTRIPVLFPEQAELLGEMVAATIGLLRGQPLGQRWSQVGPVRWRWLTDDDLSLVEDSSPLNPLSGFGSLPLELLVGSTRDAWQAQRGDVAEIFARDELGLLRHVVESRLAPALGLTGEQARMLAVLVERLVDGPDHPGEPWRPRPGWLTARAHARLRELAEHNPGARALLARDQRLRDEITALFADQPAWRDLALRFAEEFQDTAINIARLPDLPETDLHTEYHEALAGLRQLIAGHPDLTPAQRQSADKALQQDGPRRWEIQVELRYLLAATEHARLWPTDTELFTLAVRNITWGYLLSGAPELHQLRESATTTLIETATPELRQLLHRQTHHGGPQLVRVQPAIEHAIASATTATTGWVAIQPRHPHLFTAARIPLNSPFATNRQDEVPNDGELDQEKRNDWAEDLEKYVPIPTEFNTQYRTLRGYLALTIALLRGHLIQTDHELPPVRFHLLSQPITDQAGREAAALARLENGTLVVYATGPHGAHHVLTKTLFTAWDGLTGEQQWHIAELADRAAGPWEPNLSDEYRYKMRESHISSTVWLDADRRWLSIRVLDRLINQQIHSGSEYDWRLFRGDHHRAERNRVVEIFANQPNWADLTGSLPRPTIPEHTGGHNKYSDR